MTSSSPSGGRSSSRSAPPPSSTSSTSATWSATRRRPRPTPPATTFSFEKGAAKHGGGDGFADVWKKGFFGWEYKGKHKDLDAAYDQLLLYRDALENPPLLVVCDMDRIVIHTNFTDTAPATHEIPPRPDWRSPGSLEILRAVFFDPEKLKPGKTSEAITQEAAEPLRRHRRGHARSAAWTRRTSPISSTASSSACSPRTSACCPTRSSPASSRRPRGDPASSASFLGQLFAAMANGGDFGLESIRHFNGNLFDDACGA